jgi:DNA-binding CsgD family transcriptional regulator
MSDSRDYGPFFRFLQTYSPVGFKDIDPADPLILELENNMEKNDQYFVIGDLISMNIVYSSKRSLVKLGIDPALVNPYHFFEATHPDDIQRHSLGRAKVFKTAQDIFITGEGCSLLSSNFRMRNPDGIYENTLYQCYVFFNRSPVNTVYLFQLLTNIEGFNKNDGFHYYRGKDLYFFRYPDDELLMTGPPFSDREFEIIQLVGQSMSSEQIAEKLFLSTHTVNTHRRNILKKTGKTNISDLIYSLKEEGLM